MRFVNDWRAGKTTIKETIKRRGSDENEKAPTTEDEVEKRFLDKVERELALPEYSTFSTYFSFYRSRIGADKQASCSRLRRDGHSIRLRYNLEYRLAHCSCLCAHQQLRGDAERRIEAVQAC